MHTHTHMYVSPTSKAATMTGITARTTSESRRLANKHHRDF